MVRVATGLSKARPFAGLRAFDLRDAKFFFGRDDQMAAMYRLVDRNRFVAVIGSSGSG
jgi:ABC-type phosphate transport system ATPase subunit